MPANATEPLSILMVDSDPVSAETMRRIARRRNWLFQWAREPRSALSAIRKDRFNLLIMDKVFDGHDGEGLELVRNLPRNDVNLPVLMISGQASTADRVAGLKAGADCFLPKPVDDAELEAQVIAIARRLGFLGTIGRIL